MAKTISSFCLVAFFIGVVLLGNGPNVIATRTVEKRMLQQGTWCVAKQGLSDVQLQGAIDYFCGQLKAGCDTIRPGGPCFQPDTKYDHASFAINLWSKGHGAVCPSDVGETTTINPSHGSCIYV